MEMHELLAERLYIYLIYFYEFNKVTSNVKTSFKLKKILFRMNGQITIII